jgi:hypothetical protein
MNLMLDTHLLGFKFITKGAKMAHNSKIKKCITACIQFRKKKSC